MSRIVLVSNRVMDLNNAVQAGGVSVALADVLRAHGGLWFGWSGEICEPSPDEDRVYIADDGTAAVATVPMTSDEHQRYYLGYSNSVLWPVFHNRLDLARFDAGFYSAYLDVNRRLAEALYELLRPDDVVWIHDYHFLPFAQQLRRLGAHNAIGFFLHIPFPPGQTFCAIPEHDELAHALSAYDLIGLQTKADVANFLDAMRQSIHGQLLQDGRVRLFERTLEVGSFPVSIDPRDFAQAKHVTRSVQARPTARRIIGIDRLDYTKGLPHKFRAYGDFLERFPEYRGDVVLTQIAPPTRESVEAYEDIRLELERLAGSINGRYGELDWVPIHYIHRPIARDTLGDIYRSSRIGLVTPLRDGMNLVCKEYVAAQDPADPGVLILSRFAGAAEELTEALLVNPYHVEEVAEAIRAALEMSLAERQARHAALNETVRRNNAFQWCSSFLASLAQAHTRQDVPPGWRPLETGWRSTEKVRAAFQRLQRAAGEGAAGEAMQERPARRRTASALREGS